MVKKINATIVADSINEQNDRITTFIVTFPRFLLAEMNTHRMFSRNSASSRARPFQTMLKEVKDDPFIPIRWLTTHKGMQGTVAVDDPTIAIEKWLKARDAAIQAAIDLDKENVTKQLVNRLLEPYMWHEVIITATTFENFFALRAHPDAEIHIAYLAELMLNEYNASTPKVLSPNQWHLPFSDQFDEERLATLVKQTQKTLDQIKREIVCARCARISYRPFGSEDNYDYVADCKLFNSLVEGNHMSPLEHCGYAMTQEQYKENPFSGNFKGFIQFRKLFKTENRMEPRIIKKRTRED